jgi:hypothetical protein
MSNLIPEKRVNKNGVAVTKHVKPAGAPSASLSGLPAPALPTAGASHETPSAERVHQQLDARYLELHGNTGRGIPSYGYELPYIDKFPATVREEVFEFLKTAEADEVAEISSFFEHSYDKPNRFSAYVNTIRDLKWIERCAGETSDRRINDSFRQIYDRLELSKTDTKVDEFHYGVIKAELIASRLHLSPAGYSVPHLYYREVETLRANFDDISPSLPVVFAAMESREAAYRKRLEDRTLPQEDRKYSPITGEWVMEVAEYAQRYPDATQLIADTIRERGEFDRELIDSMIATSAGAVASGVL